MTISGTELDKAMEHIVKKIRSDNRVGEMLINDLKKKGLDECAIVTSFVKTVESTNGYDTLSDYGKKVYDRTIKGHKHLLPERYTHYRYPMMMPEGMDENYESAWKKLEAKHGKAPKLSKTELARSKLFMKHVPELMGKGMHPEKIIEEITMKRMAVKDRVKLSDKLAEKSLLFARNRK